MAKSDTLFVCQNCGQTYPKWQGRCDTCGEWNTLVEEAKPTKKAGLRGSAAPSKVLAGKVVSLPEVEPLSGTKQRFSTGIGELDRVLGGGLVPGSVILIGGEPGIGKSTLLTQVVVNMLTGGKNKAEKTDNPKTILYVAGEESPSQISLRINRLREIEHIDKKSSSGNARLKFSGEGLLFTTTTDVHEIAALIQQHQPNLVIVDSIQTITTEELSGAAGSVGQIREATDTLTDVAKALHIPLFLVGHVTKEGTIAGPKVLEHIVDAVLELSGERTGALRILRTLKNRFGATDEVGVFRVADFGLEEVSNPSELFLEHAEQAVPGSATVCVMEGTRPLLAEVQALVVNSQLAMPRRVGRGIELSRIQVLSAVLQKHSHLPLGATDIFLSVAGGFSVKEPAVDLGLAVAIASSLKNKPLPKKTVFIGEVGLLGEIRAVSYLDRREKEAKRLGFTQIISRTKYQRVADVLKKLGLN
ncbi:MAG TPA: DNA repair protein RadA [Patescibacteria group bacterium]